MKWNKTIEMIPIDEGTIKLLWDGNDFYLGFITTKYKWFIQDQGECDLDDFPYWSDIDFPNED